MKEKQYLTFTEIEEISKRCRRLPIDDNTPLPYAYVEQIEMRSRQLRSDAFAAMFIGLFRGIGNGLSALGSAVKAKSAGHGHKALGASAR